MFDPAVWGTVAEWAGSSVTGLSVVAAAVIYYFDRRREHRTQAGSVLVWQQPREHGAPLLKMLNLSDKPILDYGFVAASRSRRQIAKLERDEWKEAGSHNWPASGSFYFVSRDSPMNYRSGENLYLSPGGEAEHEPWLQFNPVLYDYYGYFRDASGQYWMVDARTQRLASGRTRRRLRIGPTGLDAA
jgi:hypothetical protein